MSERGRELAEHIYDWANDWDASPSELEREIEKYAAEQRLEEAKLGRRAALSKAPWSEEEWDGHVAELEKAAKGEK